MIYVNQFCVSLFPNPLSSFRQGPLPLQCPEIPSRALHLLDAGPAGEATYVLLTWGSRVGAGLGYLGEQSWSRVGAVVRALASHQSVPGSIPGPGVICGLSLLLVLYSAPRGFSPGTPVFPSHQKPTLLNSNSICNGHSCLGETQVHLRGGKNLQAPPTKQDLGTT